MKRFVATAVAAGCLLGLVGSTPSVAGDFGYSTGGGYCVDMRRSPILDLGDAGAMISEVSQRFDHALEVSLEPGTLASASPRYDWAIEAKNACGKALGYFNAHGLLGRGWIRRGEVNEDAISKCDCYYSRMIAYN